MTRAYLSYVGIVCTRQEPLPCERFSWQRLALMRRDRMAFHDFEDSLGPYATFEALEADLSIVV